MHALPSTSSLRSLASLILIGANLVPLIGVVAWGWDLWALLVIYWIEAFSTVLLGVAKALFAERGSPDVVGQIEPLHELREKRGGWCPRPGWPPIYLRNIPFGLSMLGTWTLSIVPPSALYWLSVDRPTTLSINLLLGIGALVFAHGAEFMVEYLGQREYTDVSARELLRTPTQLTLIVMLLVMLGAAGGQEMGFVLLVGFIGAKTAIAISEVSTDRLGAVIRRLVERLGDDADLSRPQPELDLPDETVQARVTVSPKSVLLGSLSAVGFGFANHVGILVIFGFIAAVGAENIVWIAVGLGVILLIVAVRVLSYYLRYGTIEYQRRGDTLVAYDTLLEAPQWVVPIQSRSRFSIRNAIPDRIFRTGTLTISGVDTAPSDEVQFGPVTDLDEAIETLDLPVRREERPARDPAVIVASVGLILCFAAVPLGLLVTPQISQTEAFGILGAFGSFFLIPIGALLWAALSRI
ncbi:DUF6498-containing protein [Halorubrum saccharovorum]|uniref:DUF6498-containing protein n=1 Tax=Halorubrum saccharovorum TaxID=2248 RepID=UPI000ACEBBBE|nr:DUF6498-containing protein [Halorubrum saccharovorum]